MGGAGDPPDEALELAERLLDERDLLAVAGEVAVAERLLGELEVEVRVLDQRRRRRRTAGVGWAPGVARRARACADGPGVGVGRRRRRRAPPPWSRSSESSASPSVSPQTTVVGDATMICWNSGNFALVDWR